MIKKEGFKFYKLTWWQQIKLYFKPTMLSVDGVKGKGAILSYKVLDGKIIVLKNKKIRG